MRWPVVKTLFLRELRDVLRDRRTLFTMLVLPVILYPALMIGFGSLTTSRVKDLKSRSYPVMIKSDGVVINKGYEAEPGTFLARLLKVKQFDLVEVDDPAAAVRNGDLTLAVELSGDYPVGTQGRETNLGERLSIHLVRDSANDRARTVWSAYRQAYSKYREDLLPITVSSKDEATPERKGGHMFGPMLAMIVIMMAMTGAFYPALDVAAGEKERGTLETLLLSPATRLELVAGKYLTVLSVALVAALMNLLSMSLTLSRLPSMMGGGAEVGLSISWQAFLVILLGLVIVAGLFSAVCLALSTFARTYKEGQTYLTPALLVVMPLAMMAILPDMDLDRKLALVPVSNMALLMKGLLVQKFMPVETILTLGSNLLLTVAALWWTAGLFSREEVLFREGRQVFGLKPPPGVPRPVRPAFAVGLLGISLAAVWFVQAGNLISMQGVGALVIPLIGLGILAVALTKLSMAPFITGLGLVMPSVRAIAGGLLLGAGGLALSLLIGDWQRPLVGDPSEALKAMEALMAPLLELNVVWQVLILAVVPAICEELLFRGLVLQSARKTLGDVGAVLLSGLSFALLHNLDGAFQRFFPQAALGILLGLLVLRTGSLIPAIVAHAVHNGIVVVMGDQMDPEGLGAGLPQTYLAMIAVMGIAAAWFLSDSSASERVQT